MQNEDSLTDSSSIQIQEKLDRFSWYGRIRLRYLNNSNSNRAGELNTMHGWQSEMRFGIQYNFNEPIYFRLRYGGKFTNSQDRLRFTLSDHTVTETGTRPGESTFDEFNLTWDITDRLWLRVGRMQVVFPLRGVIPRALNRYDKPVVFTDGFWVNWGFHRSWNLHFVTEYNSPSGAATVARNPLRFDDSGSRVTLWSMLQHKDTRGLWTQRELSVHIIPNSFIRDDEFQDYIVITSRIGLNVPLGLNWMGVSIGLEGGFAPNTPSPNDLGFEQGELRDEGSYGWQGMLNFNDIQFLNFYHNIVFHYGQVDPGWLVSPDFNANTRVFEARYQFVVNKELSLEFRYRQRHELYLPTSEQFNRKNRNLFARLTYRI